MRSIHIKTITIMLVVLLAAMAVQAQKATTKSRSVGNDREIELLLDSAEVKMNTDYSGAFDDIRSALEISVRNGNISGEVRSYQLLARTHYRLGQYDLASDYFRNALKYQSAISTELQMEIRYEYALSLEKEYRKDQAVNELNKVLNYARSRSDIPLEIQIRQDLARILLEKNDAPAALIEYDAIEELEKKRHNPRGIADANNMRGNVLYKQNKSKEAINNYQNAERIADEIQDTDLKAMSLRNQADVYRQNQQYDDEFRVRQQALQISDQQEMSNEAVQDNLKLGELYLETQQPDQALPYIQRSIDLAEKTGDLKTKGTALQKESEVYGIRGDYTKALLSYQQYAVTMDSFYARRERELQGKLDLIADVSPKLQRIDLLEQDIKLTRTMLSLARKEQKVSARELDIQRWISYGLIILTLGLGISTFLIYRSSRQKRKANLLLALRSLRSQMNPHFIFNSLNSVNSYIAANNERQANKYLSDFSNLMRQVLENSKHDFVPIQTEVEVLKLYLKLEHSRFSEKFDYTFEVDKTLLNTDYAIPPMLIQPYIENAIWHGLRYRDGKGKLAVELKRDKDVMKAEIRDDGIGRQKSQELKTPHQMKNASTGMKNTRSRLDIINEVYDLNYKVDVEDMDPEEGSGTRVTLVIPLENKELTKY